MKSLSSIRRTATPYASRSARTASSTFHWLRIVIDCCVSVLVTLTHMFVDELYIVQV
jgi:hypothetical protein